MLRKLQHRKPDGYMSVEERMEVIGELMTMDRRVNDLFIWTLAYEYNKRPGGEYLMPDLIAELMKVLYPDTRQRGIKTRLEYWLDKRLVADPTVPPGRLFNEIVWYFQLDRQINRAKIKNMIKQFKDKHGKRQAEDSRRVKLEEHFIKACEELLLKPPSPMGQREPEELPDLIGSDTKAAIKQAIRKAKVKAGGREYRNRKREQGLEEHLTEACEEVVEACDVFDEGFRDKSREIIQKLSRNQDWTTESFNQRKARLDRCFKRACACLCGARRQACLCGARRQEELALTPSVAVTEVAPEPIDVELTRDIMGLIGELRDKTAPANCRETPDTGGIGKKQKKRVVRFPRWSIVPETAKPPQMFDPRRAWAERILGQSHQVIVAFVIMFCKEWCKVDDAFGKQLAERVLSVAFPGDKRYPTALQCWVRDMLAGNPALTSEDLIGEIAIRFKLDRFKMRGYLGLLTTNERRKNTDIQYKRKHKAGGKSAPRVQTLAERRSLRATR